MNVPFSYLYEKIATKRYVFGILLMITIGSLTWLYLSLPYRLFSYDDHLFQGPASVNINADLRHCPLFWHFLSICKVISSLFSADINSALLLSTLGSHALSSFFLAVIVLRLTRNFLLSLISVVIFYSSVLTSHFFYTTSYMPFATAIHLLTLWFILKKYDQLSKAGNNEEYNLSRGWLFSLGVLFSLAILTSTSALIMIGLQFLLVMILLFQKKNLIRKGLWVFLGGGFVLFVQEFLFSLTQNERWSWIWETILHWGRNLRGHHALDAFNKYGLIPKPPIFSFFRMYFELEPIFSVIAFLILVLGTTIIIGKLMKGKLTQFEMKLSGLLLLVWVHSLTIDLLPFTKLLRTHFPVYPIVIIASLLVVHWLSEFLKSSKSSKMVYKGFRGIGILALAGLGINLHYSYQLIAVSHKSANTFLINREFKDFYFLKSDAHAPFIAEWLEVPPKYVTSIVDVPEHANRTRVLVVGPRGTGSGKSILRHTVLDDFLFEEEKLRCESCSAILRFPFYGYFPPYLFEEENGQGMYFMGKIPPLNDPTKELVALVWKGEM